MKKQCTVAAGSAHVDECRLAAQPQEGNTGSGRLFCKGFDVSDVVP